MPKLLSTLSILALMALPLQSVAQETQTEAPADAQAQEEPVVDDLPMGEEIADENAIGSAYLREVSGDWGMECIRVEEGKDEPCQMFQSLKDDKGNLVSNVRIFKLNGSGKAVAGALIAVPLETLLTAQLTITVDGGKGKRYPFTVCDRLGCYARIGLSAEDVAAFKKGAKAQVGIVPFVAPDERLQLDMSLTGFTAGFDKATTMPSP